MLIMLGVGPRGPLREGFAADRGTSTHSLKRKDNLSVPQRENSAKKFMEKGEVFSFWNPRYTSTWGRGREEARSRERSPFKTKKLRYGKALFHFETEAKEKAGW